MVVRVQRSLPVSLWRYTEIIRDLQPLVLTLVTRNSAILTGHAYKYRVIFFLAQFRPCCKLRVFYFLKNCIDFFRIIISLKKCERVAAFMKDEGQVKFIANDKIVFFTKYLNAFKPSTTWNLKKSGNLIYLWYFALPKIPSCVTDAYGLRMTQTKFRSKLMLACPKSFFRFISEIRHFLFHIILWIYVWSIL